MKTQVTKNMVEVAKRYINDEKYKDLTNAELAVLCGTSAATLSRIKCGHYDFMLEDDQKKSVATLIPYEELEYLISCKTIVDGIFCEALLSEKIPDGLFIPSGKIYTILKSNLPNKVLEKYNKLREEENNE